MRRSRRLNPRTAPMWLAVLSIASTALSAPRQETLGTIAFYSERDGNAEIYTMAPDGSHLQRLTTDPADDVTPAWSPDGLRIAFASDRNGNDDIFVMHADGSGQRALTDDGALCLYVMDADGSNQRRLTDHPAGDFWPDWTPVSHRR